MSLQLQQQLLAVLHELRDVAVAESNRNRKLVAAVDILAVVLEASATMANKSSESSTAVSVRNEALEVISSSASRPPCRLAGWCPSWNRCSGRPVRVREGALRAGIATGKAVRVLRSVARHAATTVMVHEMAQPEQHAERTRGESASSDT